MIVVAYSSSGGPHVGASVMVGIAGFAAVTRWFIVEETSTALRYLTSTAAIAGIYLIIIACFEI